MGLRAVRKVADDNSFHTRFDSCSSSVSRAPTCKCFRSEMDLQWNEMLNRVVLAQHIFFYIFRNFTPTYLHASTLKLGGRLSGANFP